MRHLAFILILLCGCASKQPSRFGIENFHEVTPIIFRGAQPDTDSFAALEAAGVRSVLNLCASDCQPWEEERVRKLGLNYKQVPLPGYGAPTRDQVSWALTYLSVIPKPVFVHCKRGRDRTGAVIALWRMNNGWSKAEAVREMDACGFSTFQMGIRRFVEGQP